MILESHREAISTLRKMAYTHAGIALSEQKEGLVQARVQVRMQALGLNHPQQYVSHLRANPNGKEMVQFLDCITTNVTAFMRDPQHYTAMMADLSKLTGPVRVWSAACSTGMEPYSMAMHMASSFGFNRDWRVLGTDLSKRALEHASRAIYTRSDVEAVSPEWRERWLEFGSADHVRIERRLRARVTLGRLNLLKRPYPMKGPFHLVYCRYVLMYFDEVMRRGVLTEVTRLMAPNALLFLGAGEALDICPEGLEVVGPSVFRRK